MTDEIVDLTEVLNNLKAQRAILIQKSNEVRDHLIQINKLIETVEANEKKNKLIIKS